MKLNVDVKVNLKTKEVIDRVTKATKGALVDTVAAIAEDTIKNAKSVGFWDTGHNARSIMYEVGPSGEVAKKDSEGAVYSTSGYGGYGETGTRKMAARPYMKPALDKNFTAEKFAEGIKARLA